LVWLDFFSSVSGWNATLVSVWQYVPDFAPTYARDSLSRELRLLLLAGVDF
jgi:hypothetical protein